MRKVPAVFRQAHKAIADLDLLKVLQSEINHELSAKTFRNDESSSFGDFVVDWDSPQSQDVVLRRRCESGEEVAVSALLGAVGSNESAKFPREAFMKVGVKKPGLRSLLQFDCVAAQVDNGCEVQIQNVNYIPSPDLDSSACKGPYISFFSSSDQRLKDEFHKYLEARGVGKSFTESLLLYLHKKEQGQYVEWLHKLQGTTWMMNYIKKVFKNSKLSGHIIFLKEEGGTFPGDTFYLPRPHLWDSTRYVVVIVGF